MRFNKDILPIVGVVAFSTCSTWSIAHLFFEKAKHDTVLFWIPAALLELTTAWLVWSIVETTRKVTKSNISKQDRRFYSIVLAMFVALAIPSLTVSIIANTIEFGGSVLLGILFPLMSVACAVGAGLPSTVSRYATERQAERKERQSERKAAARRVKETARQRQEIVKQCQGLGKAAATLWQLVANPAQTQATIAQTLSISRQAVGNHIAILEQVGAISRKDGVIEVLWNDDILSEIQP